MPPGGGGGGGSSVREVSAVPSERWQSSQPGKRGCFILYKSDSRNEDEEPSLAPLNLPLVSGNDSSFSSRSQMTPC